MAGVDSRLERSDELYRSLLCHDPTNQPLLLLSPSYARPAELCRTAIEPAVIRDHEHNFPFKHVVADQAAAYARNILVCLHLFELTA